MPGVSVRMVDPETGRALGQQEQQAGQAGELRVKVRSMSARARMGRQGMYVCVHCATVSLLLRFPCFSSSWLLLLSVGCGRAGPHGLLVLLGAA